MNMKSLALVAMSAFVGFAIAAPVFADDSADSANIGAPSSSDTIMQSQNNVDTNAIPDTQSGNNDAGTPDTVNGDDDY